jgi:carboxymethylenebutenolidase
MKGAVDFLIDHDAVDGNAVGVVGFCMGGMLALVLAAQEGARVKVAVPFYGTPFGENEPDWSNLKAVVRGHVGGNDDYFPPDAAQALAGKLTGMGKDVQFTVYPGRGHAFCNEDNAFGTYDEADAEKAITSAIATLHDYLA